jgi:hypothetical protein
LPWTVERFILGSPAAFNASHSSRDRKFSISRILGSSLNTRTTHLCAPGSSSCNGSIVSFEGENATPCNRNQEHIATIVNTRKPNKKSHNIDLSLVSCVVLVRVAWSFADCIPIPALCVFILVFLFLGN